MGRYFAVPKPSHLSSATLGPKGCVLWCSVCKSSIISPHWRPNVYNCSGRPLVCGFPSPSMKTRKAAVVGVDRQTSLHGYWTGLDWARWLLKTVKCAIWIWGAPTDGSLVGYAGDEEAPHQPNPTGSRKKKQQCPTIDCDEYHLWEIGRIAIGYRIAVGRDCLMVLKVSWFTITILVIHCLFL